MNLVKTYIDKSPIEGIGLFAAEFIPKGTVVWAMTENERFFTYDEVEKLDQPFKDHVLKYGYTENGKYILCCDTSIFYNHSANPNVVSDGEFEVSAKDIHEGEELTCNYFSINDDHSREIFKYLEK